MARSNNPPLALRAAINLVRQLGTASNKQVAEKLGLPLPAASLRLSRAAREGWIRRVSQGIYEVSLREERVTETPDSSEPTPIPMILFCPLCHARHIDEGEFATRPHHSHSCQNCGLTWRPAIVPTVGVQFLPGFKTS